MKTGSWAPITFILAIKRNRVLPTSTPDLMIEPCSHFGILGLPTRMPIRMAQRSLNKAWKWIKLNIIFTGLDKKNFFSINISLPIILTYILGAQKNRLIETVLLSIHNICFDWEIRELIFWFAHLTKGLHFIASSKFKKFWTLDFQILKLQHA